MDTLTAVPPLCHRVGSEAPRQAAELRLEPMPLSVFVRALGQREEVMVYGRTNARWGDRVTVIVNNVPFRGTVGSQGEFAVPVAMAHLVASAEPVLTAVVIATDAQGSLAAARACMPLPLAEMRRAWLQSGRRLPSKPASSCVEIKHV